MVEARRSPESARVALAKRRAEADARAQEKIEILRLSAARLRHRTVADVLERILMRGMRFVLDTLTDVARPQPWAVTADGDVLGHLLTVDDDVFEIVAGECMVEVLTLPDALARMWVNLGERSGWAAAYVGALRALATDEELRDQALQLREAMTREIGNAGSDGGSGPLV